MYRRKRSRRRIYKRRSYRKRKVPRRYRNNGTRFFKIRYEANVQTGVSAITDDPTFGSPRGWDQISTLFGYYRVTFMAITFIPNFNNIPVGSNPVNNPVIFWHDWNDTGNATRANMIAYEGSRFYTGGRVIRFARKMIRRIPATLDAPAQQPQVLANGFIRTGRPMATQRILLSLDGANNEGTIVVTKYIAARQRL